MPAVSDFTMPRQRSIAAGNEDTTFGLISYNLTDVHTKARALYVSSGNDLKRANSMIDDQPATSYAFAGDDSSPTTIIDLGKESKLRRASVVFSPRRGTMDFYVLRSLPGATSSSAAPENAPNTVRLGSDAFASLHAVGSVTDDGSQGRASVDFAATTGRYVMVRFTPTAQQDGEFNIAEVAAFGSGQNKSLASNGTLSRSRDNSGGKELREDTSKEELDSSGKEEIPAEGPAENTPPGEGPPPNLPPPPPFTFIPEILPTSP